MTLKLLLATGLLFTTATAAFAEESADAPDKPSFAASRTITLGATVVAVDHETREVTLEGADGETVSFTAGDDVRNLDQVEAGDAVLAEVFEEITVDVFANPEGVEPGAGEFVAAARAEAGEAPGAGVMDTVIISAIVEEIDLEANTFKLRGPEGNVREFTAANPENLKRAETGDLVVITITQAVGIMVAHPNSE